VYCNQSAVSPKSVNKLVGFADSLLSALTKRGSWDGNRDAATTFIKEWLPKYAQALLNRGYIYTHMSMNHDSSILYKLYKLDAVEDSHSTISYCLIILFHLS